MHFKLKVGKPQQKMTFLSKTDEDFNFLDNDMYLRIEGENYDPLKSTTFTKVSKILDSHFSLINETIELKNERKEKKRSF